MLIGVLEESQSPDHSRRQPTDGSAVALQIKVSGKQREGIAYRLALLATARW
jgi:hypothetical protein